jgi:glycosyltransferase involved in cell wall biosynthesis
MGTPHVLCFQQRLTHYRETFFQQAKDALAAKGIAFDLVYGQPDATAQIRKDSGHLPWAHAVQEKTFQLGKFTGVWVPTPATLARPDLVIVTQENKLLANYAWLLRRVLGGPKVAYWGHGANFQSNAPAGVRERWKQLLLTKVDWWFAYTQMTVDILTKAGYPQQQITNLNNAIDTGAFKRDLAAVADADLAVARQVLGIAPGAMVGIFCGSLYPDKKLDFLVDACDRIYQQSTDFHCVVLGDGPSMPFLRDAAATRPWLHLRGVTKGAQKALYFRMAAFMLNPGLVGLHIVDAFCAGLVMVTTTGARHSPEVCYLRDGINGVMTSDSTAEYAQRVLALIRHPAALATLRAASLADADVYTLEKMVANFTEGIARCLGRYGE